MLTQAGRLLGILKPVPWSLLGSLGEWNAPSCPGLGLLVRYRGQLEKTLFRALPISLYLPISCYPLLGILLGGAITWKNPWSTIGTSNLTHESLSGGKAGLA